MSENHPFFRDNPIIGDLKNLHNGSFLDILDFERSEIINMLLKSIEIKIVC